MIDRGDGMIDADIDAADLAFAAQHRDFFATRRTQRPRAGFSPQRAFVCASTATPAPAGGGSFSFGATPAPGPSGFGGLSAAPAAVAAAAGTQATVIRDAHSLTAWLLAQHGARLEGST